METLPAPITIPTAPRDLRAAARRAQQIVTRRALVSAGASVVPVPGLDIAVDIGLYMSLVEDINAEFGLTPAQIERLSPRARALAFRAITLAGPTLVGRVLTREAVVGGLKLVGVRLTAKQAARWVPVAGQVVAATLSFTAIKILGDRHVQDCVRVAGAFVDLNPPPRR